MLLDRREVREESAEPPFGDEHRSGTFRLRADNLRQLRFGTHEENVVATHDDVAGQLLSDFDLPQGLLQIDDVNPVAFGENEPAHLGIPPSRLVSEMHAGREELLHRGLHVCHVVR